MNYFQIFSRFIIFHVFVAILWILRLQLLLLLLVRLLLKHLIVLSNDFWLQPTTCVRRVVFYFNEKLNIWFNEYLNKSWRFCWYWWLRRYEVEMLVAGLIELTAIRWRIHAACQPFLLLVPFIMGVVLNGFFLIYNFIIISLLYNLSTLLFTCCKEVLYWDIILWLNLYLLLIAK